MTEDRWIMAGAAMGALGGAYAAFVTGNGNCIFAGMTISVFLASLVLEAADSVGEARWPPRVVPLLSPHDLRLRTAIILASLRDRLCRRRSR